MIRIPNKEYRQRVKWIKKMYNEEDRCLMCGGSSGNIIGGLGSSLRMEIQDDTLRFRIEEETDAHEYILNEFYRLPINFCPYCGRQLRKEINWSLCD